MTRAAIWSTLLALTTLAGSAMPSPSLSAAATTPVYLQWLRVDSNHPQTLFVGGRFGCPRWLEGLTCPNLIMRSTDGGVHWTDLVPTFAHLAIGPGAFVSLLADPNVDYEVTPIVIADDGRHVYLDVAASASASSQFAYVLRSLDARLHWQILPTHGWLDHRACNGGWFNGGMQDLTISSVTRTRLYAEIAADDGSCGEVVVSDDEGRTFRTASNPDALLVCPEGCRPWGGLVADPVRPNTVYANVIYPFPIVTPPIPAYVARSDDAGLHWSVVMTPTASPPLQTFTVSTDPHEGALLVGRTQDTGVPADRRYLSADEGRSWRVATCPGDLHGVCPAFTVDNVFGAGASYGFVANGVYRLHGSGPAVARQHLGARLPFTTAALIDVGAGHHAGDPVYVLDSSVRGPEHGLLYRSSDGGHTWQRLLAGPFPLRCGACMDGSQ